MKTFDPFDLRLVLLEEDVNVRSTGFNDDEDDLSEGEGEGTGT